MSISIKTNKGRRALAAPVPASEASLAGAEDLVARLRAHAGDAVCDGIDPAPRHELPTNTHIERGDDRDVA